VGARAGRSGSRPTKSLALLEGNRLSLDALAQPLFASGYLDRGEIDAIIAKYPLEPATSATPAVTSRTVAPPINDGGTTVSDPAFR
jgi:cell division protease FtsH